MGDKEVSYRMGSWAEWIMPLTERSINVNWGPAEAPRSCEALNGWSTYARVEGGLGWYFGPLPFTKFHMQSSLKAARVIRTFLLPINNARSFVLLHTAFTQTLAQRECVRSYEAPMNAFFR